MSITTNRSSATPPPWKVWETCSHAVDRVARLAQPLFENLSWAASGLFNLATPAINASISIGKLASSKTSLTVSLVALSLSSGASTPSSTQMVSTNISDFLINTYTNGSQSEPSMAVFSDDSFVVTWEGEGVGDSIGIFGQRFFANGSLWEAEFRANNYTSGVQREPKTAAFPGDSFLLIWYGEGDGDSVGIFGQRFFANGSAWGAEFRANNYTNGDQLFPSTAPFSDGSFVITWQGEGVDDSFGIFGRRFFANGSAWGPEFRVNNYTNGNQFEPNTASFSDGSFIVTWFGEGVGDSSGIFAQRFFANGSAWGSEFRTNNYTSGIQQDSSPVSFSDGSFVVTWESLEQDGNGYGIFGQHFFANGSAWRPEFRVNNYTNGNQRDISAEAFSDDSFVVTWHGEGVGDSFGIFGQRFFPNGSIWEPEFRANNNTNGNQQDSIIKAFSDGSFFVTWEGEETPGSSVYNVYGKRFDRFGQPVPWEEVSFSPSASIQTTHNPSMPTLASTETSFSSQMTSESSTRSDNITPIITISPSPSDSPQSTRESSAPSLASTDTSMTSLMTPESSTRSDNTIPIITMFIYSQPYPITLNGQSIGTFSFTGGTGQIDSNNVNTLNINFSSDFEIQDGLALTLFSVPERQEVVLGTITTESECFTAEGELIPSTVNLSENDYQLIFTLTSDACTIYTDASKVTAMPVLISGLL